MEDGSAARKNLLDRLLSSVKQVHFTGDDNLLRQFCADVVYEAGCFVENLQVQIHFGARQEIATETDLRYAHIHGTNCAHR